jgi:spore germination cell wall hydrolase CwlJ-like protein
MSQSGILLLIAALAAHNHQVRVEGQAHAETKCMAQALYYEARSEGERGQEAVAEVILHRARSGLHAHTICGVVHEPRQFSFVSDGSMARKLDLDAWNSANQLANRILRHEIVTTMTGRAQFYHAVSVQPEWANTLVRTAQIGNHIFYR